jgi:hypothetical protein
VIGAVTIDRYKSNRIATIINYAMNVICLFVCLFVCVFVCLFICLFVILFICLYVGLFICLSVLVPSPDLDEDTKRWLVVGICLHSVISPALRQYVKPFVTQGYKTAQQTHGIQAQTYQNYLEHYPPTNKHLNYESVNENKHKYGTRYKQYDYKIADAVEYSKLFLSPFMAHYTKFDSTCDLSALLGIIANINTFPQTVKLDAENVSCYCI